MSSCDVAVLGAGPAGLAAAFRAAQAGRQVVLMERASGPGGMAASFDVAGVRVDHGSHRLHPSIDPAILAELRRLLGDDLQTRERNGRIRLAGRWIAFPLRATDMVRHLPRRFALAAARDMVTGPLRHPRADTFAEVVRARLGPTVADHFYAPYVEKLWGVPPTELAGELARRRVSATSPLAIIRRMLRARSAEGRSFLYPRRGFGQISEVLADAAVGAGADVRFETVVERVELGDRARVTAGGEAVEADRAWSTLPLGALVGMVDPAPSPEVLTATGELRHRGLLLVYLVVERDRYTPFDAHYFPEAEIPVARLSEPKNYRDDPDDPRDRTVLCAEVPCWPGDDQWSASDRDLASMVADALERAGLPAVHAIEAVVRRLPKVYPLYRPEILDRLAVVEGWLAHERRLLTFGRQGLFVPDNAHHALAMGWAAADALGPDGTFDHRTWQEARRSFHTHVVED